jgi:hypothetical protein
LVAGDDSEIYVESLNWSTEYLGSAICEKPSDKHLPNLLSILITLAHDRMTQKDYEAKDNHMGLLAIRTLRSSPPKLQDSR